ncbi:heme/hemin ABC transporter substrate-binding protein [Niabella sp. CJ426]|uniref:heme/hemin ABC transporter substrate-binding protein n=1 Tax=Niabella sp. CJ426 TaxID=3393740 RepID=UPI003D05AB2B
MMYSNTRTIQLNKKYIPVLVDMELKRLLPISLLILLLTAGWLKQGNCSGPQRIITLGAAITETTAALGFGADIVATDVTSEYPAFTRSLPKVSRNRNLSVEGLMQFNPTLILAPEGDIPAAVMAQLKKAKINVISLRQEFSVKGAERFILAVAISLNAKKEGIELLRQMQIKLNAITTTVSNNKQTPLKVLFIYARGAGNMTVAGKGSNMDAIIHLAGGANAVKEFTEFKPYSTEALIAANPDVLLLFDFGAKSLGGPASILNMPGVKLTHAGQAKRIVEVDGPLMVNFSSRLPEAIAELHHKLYGK